MIIQAGRLGVEVARARASEISAPDDLRIVPFLGDIGDAYAAADLVVARAGAMTLAELAAAAVPAVLVPYPWAAEDHQRVNARRFAAAGAARVIDPDDLTAESLAVAIEELLSDPETRARMAESARGSEGAGARARIADACERYLA